jgi:hypothetical protein
MKRDQTQKDADLLKLVLTIPDDRSDRTSWACALIMGKWASKGWDIPPDVNAELVEAIARVSDHIPPEVLKYALDIAKQAYEAERAAN